MVQTKAPEKQYEMVKPLPPMDQGGEPGKWGYYCKKCSTIALVFPGEELPHISKPIEEMAYMRAGKHKLRLRTEPTCGQCANKLDLGPYNYVRMDRVLDVDSWCKAKGTTLEKLGYPPRSAQKASDFNQNGKGGVVRRMDMISPEDMRAHVERCTEEPQD